ncbi:CBO0543 family protein [Saccharococcus caldoxylosilyticus]|uniref:CBO0543 family protein n=1 Tax=Saccharococcus caldoxylosilyticus TaxID=81408 RepID=UPI000309EE50|nr:CBO0543 family protein [Parageobacillus caldoxylosilyticus]
MFEVMLAMWCLLASWYWGDWKNIEKYYPTLLYVTVANLIYKVIALFHFHLWKVKGAGMLGDTAAYFVDLLFIMVPATLIYLSNYPDTAQKQIFYIAKWVTLFTVIEWIGLEYFNTINHHNGWNM